MINAVWGMGMVAGLLLSACSPTAAVGSISATPMPGAAPTNSLIPGATLTPSGASTGAPTDSPTPRVTDTLVPGTPTATATAATPTAIPVGRLPGLEPDQIAAGLADFGYTCGGPSFSAGVFRWSCELIQGQGWFTVLIYSRTTDTVDIVAGTVERLAPVANDPVSLQLLDFIAALPYTGAQPAQARAWVEQTLPMIQQNGDLRSTTFGGVRFQLYGLPTARNLQVGTFAVP